VHLELIRSGGFAGISRRVSLPGDALASEEVVQLERGLQALASEGGAGPGRSGPGGADRYQYDLTVETDGQTRHLSAGEAELPADLRHLLDDLLARGA